MHIPYIIAAIIAFICAVKIFIILVENEIEEEDKGSFYDPKDHDNFLF
jgi:glycerol uptake facilitator-like aquaporin